MHPPPICLHVLLCTIVISAVGVLPPYSRFQVPFAHVALSGDVQLWLYSPPSILPPLILSIWRLDDGKKHLVADVLLHTPLQALGSNATRLTLPCGYLSKGGTYLLRLRTSDQNLTETETYEDSKLSGVLDVRWPAARLSMTPENIETFPEHSVTGIVEFPKVMCEPIEEAALPEFWLELSHCGDTLCPTDSSKSSPPLYSQNITGLPGRREFPLRCELFGAAGTYALTLTPSPSSETPAVIPTPAYLKARWSEQFVLNVHARSLFPCDGHSGVSVLFQYPACVLQRADRVRVFARDPPPLTATSPRSSRGDLKYVAELRVDRGSHSLRFPCDLFSERYPEYCFVYVSQALNGAVADVRQECLPTLPILDGATAGGWGPWSSWSACPQGCGGTRTRYRYCDSPPPPYGAAYCKGKAVESQPCTNDNSSDPKLCPWDESIVGLSSINVADNCHCGCVLPIGKTAHIIAVSAQGCKGQNYWLFQTSPGHVIQLTLEKYKFSCGAQYLKVRDGSLRAAPLLAAWPSDDSETSSKNELSLPPIVSSGDSMLLEYFSDELLAAGPSCSGGFVMNVTQMEAVAGNASASIANISGMTRRANDTGAMFLIILIVAGLILTAPAACWVTLRILHASRKYQRAADCDSLADSDIGPGSAAALSNRLTGSSGTLLSEVLSLRRLRAGRGGSASSGHHLLRESKDMSEERTLDAPQNDAADVQAGGWSSGSSVTLAALNESSETNDSNEARPGSGRSLPAGNTDKNHKVSPLRRSRTCSPARSSHATPHHTSHINSLVSDGDNTSMSVDISTSERDSDNSCDIKDLRKSMITSRAIRKGTLSENGSRSESNTTLTNGCYSPALSSTSCARVRTTNGKEKKERRNLRLRAPPSDLSLAAPEFEFDYYDYNVSNAGAAPGSYLGMDPAFLVWIPPLEDGDIIKEMDEKHNSEDILPMHIIDPGSNTESPEEFLDVPPISKSYPRANDGTPQSSPRIDRRLAMKTNIVHPLNFSISDLAPAKLVESNRMKHPRNEKTVSIQMREFSNNKYDRDMITREKYDEKEPYCEKSPTQRKYTDISDIQFADDDSDSCDDDMVIDNKNAGSSAMKI